jgi:hypothetical protein
LGFYIQDCSLTLVLSDTAVQFIIIFQQLQRRVSQYIIDIATAGTLRVYRLGWTFSLFSIGRDPGQLHDEWQFPVEHNSIS